MKYINDCESRYVDQIKPQSLCIDWCLDSTEIKINFLNYRN